MHAILLVAALAAGTLPEHPRLLFRAEAVPQIRERIGEKLTVERTPAR